MSFNILSMISGKPILIKGNKSILTSFPGSFKTLDKLGATLFHENKILRPVITIDGPAASEKEPLLKE